MVKQEISVCFEGEKLEESETMHPGKALTQSIASDGLDLTADAADSVMDALMSNGALDGVPIFGLLHGLYKTTRLIPEVLYQRKVGRLLQAIAKSSDQQQRQKFSEKIERDGESERLGETILLFLDKADEVQKPTLMGRIVAAHIRDELDQKTTFRICAMINRAYYPDLELLKYFRYGTGAPNQSIFNTLAAVGFLDNGGFDGGQYGTDDPLLAGGDIFIINDYGIALLQFGFKMIFDAPSEIQTAERHFNKSL